MTEPANIRPAGVGQPTRAESSQVQTTSSRDVIRGVIEDWTGRKVQNGWPTGLQPEEKADLVKRIDEALFGPSITGDGTGQATGEIDRLRVEILRTTTYRPFDQAEKLGPPPWKPSDEALIAWEAAHGHDARLKCYPELGCRLALSDLEALQAEISRALYLTQLGEVMGRNVMAADVPLIAALLREHEAQKP